MGPPWRLVEWACQSAVGRGEAPLGPLALGYFSFISIYQANNFEIDVPSWEHAGGLAFRVPLGRADAPLGSSRTGRLW